MEQIKIKIKTTQVTVRYMDGILENIEVYKIYPKDDEFDELLDLIYEWNKWETVSCVPVKIWQLIKRNIRQPLTVHTFEGSGILHPIQ